LTNRSVVTLYKNCFNNIRKHLATFEVCIGVHLFTIHSFVALLLRFARANENGLKWIGAIYWTKYKRRYCL